MPAAAPFWNAGAYQGVLDREKCFHYAPIDCQPFIFSSHANNDFIWKKERNRQRG